MALPTPVGRQADAVYWAGHGDLVVLGTAGTGKTVMAILRAAHLANPSTENHGPTLLVTYTRSLVSYLSHLAAEHAGRVDIRNYHRFARGYLASRGLMGSDKIVDGQRYRFLDKAIAEVRLAYNMQSQSFFDQPREFFLAELDWIAGHGMVDEAAYLAAARIGRTRPLQASFRAAVWRIRQRYMRFVSEAGKTCDWAGLPSLVREALVQDPLPRMYRHIVIDEGQDLSPEAIRSLADAVQPGGSITFFADYAQQIYGHRLSWRSLGLKVQGRSPELFTDNYRNSAEIAKLAIAMSAMPHFRDSADLVEPTSYRAQGVRPTLVQCTNEDVEATVVRNQAPGFASVLKVGVLARTREEAQRATAGLPNVQLLHDNIKSWTDAPGIYAGTYHSGKGLEFDVVFLPFCGAARMPDPAVAQAFGLEDAMSKEARLLYVGVTRARSELIVTYTGQLTSLFPAAGSGFWTVARP